MTVVEPRLLTLAAVLGSGRRRSATWAAPQPDVLSRTVVELDVDLAPPVQRVLAEAIAASDACSSFAQPVLGEALAGFAARRLGLAAGPDRGDRGPISVSPPWSCCAVRGAGVRPVDHRHHRRGAAKAVARMGIALG